MDEEEDEWDEEQRKSANRVRVPPAPEGDLHPRNGAGEGNEDEFNSPRGGEENRGRPSNGRGDMSTDKAISQSPRGGCLEWKAWCSGRDLNHRKNSQGKDPRTVVKNS